MVQHSCTYHFMQQRQGRACLFLAFSVFMVVSQNFLFSGTFNVQDLPQKMNITRVPSLRTRAHHFDARIRNIYTLGVPRTASTFQAVLLCVIAHLRSDDVQCQGEQFAALNVIKAHEISSITLDDSSMLFLTVRKDASEWTSRLNVTTEDVAYTQQYEHFSRCPLCEIEAYSETFDLSPVEVLQLRQYMRYWTILRQCCGSQMSKWMLASLYGCDMKKHFEFEGMLNFPDCDTRNLSAVEESFESSHLYSLVTTRQLLGTLEQQRFVWMKRGDCHISHRAVSQGVGFNLENISSTFCSDFESNVDKT